MQNLKARIVNFFYSEDGASALEYVVMAAMVAVFITTLSGDLQDGISNVFGKISGAMNK
ncbi:MAG: Flp family type IVb pilin [Gammaproteobacteria bacterium]